MICNKICKEHNHLKTTCAICMQKCTQCSCASCSSFCINCQCNHCKINRACNRINEYELLAIKISKQITFIEPSKRGRKYIQRFLSYNPSVLLPEYQDIFYRHADIINDLNNKIKVEEILIHELFEKIAAEKL